MRLIEPAVHVFHNLLPERLLHHLEVAGRICYKSDSPYTPETRRVMAEKLIKSGHLSVLDHPSISVLFVVNRGVSHEEVRHRIAAYSQESTRYCDYKKDKFGAGITVIHPYALEQAHPRLPQCSCTQCVIWRTWERTIKGCEDGYLELRNLGVAAEWARSVLPIGLKTEVFTTYDLHEWRHFFWMRAVGGAGRPHPQMRQGTVPLLRAFQYYIPVLFDDLVNMCEVDKDEDVNTPWAPIHANGKIHRLEKFRGGLSAACFDITNDVDPPYIPAEIDE